MADMSDPMSTWSPPSTTSPGMGEPHGRSGTVLSPFERAIDTALFWPFDLGVRAAEQLPDIAARVRDQLVFARFIGRLAVKQGNVELRRRIECDAEPDPPADLLRQDEQEAPEPTDDDPVEPDEIDVDSLALPDYEQLPAVHIIEKLTRLTRVERDLIESYEATHRGRRTVLGKLERLRES